MAKIRFQILSSPRAFTFPRNSLTTIRKNRGRKCPVHPTNQRILERGGVYLATQRPRGDPQFFEKMTFENTTGTMNPNERLGIIGISLGFHWDSHWDTQS